MKALEEQVTTEDRCPDCGGEITLWAAEDGFEIAVGCDCGSVVVLG